MGIRLVVLVALVAACGPTEVVKVGDHYEQGPDSIAARVGFGCMRHRNPDGTLLVLFCGTAVAIEGCSSSCSPYSLVNVGTDDLVADYRAIPGEPTTACYFALGDPNVDCANPR